MGYGRHLYGVQQVLVKLASPQTVDVQEDREPTQLQVNLQQADRAHEGEGYFPFFK